MLWTTTCYRRTCLVHFSFQKFTNCLVSPSKIVTLSDCLHTVLLLCNIFDIVSQIYMKNKFCAYPKLHEKIVKVCVLLLENLNTNSTNIYTSECAITHKIYKKKIVFCGDKKLQKQVSVGALKRNLENRCY